MKILHWSAAVKVGMLELEVVKVLFAAVLHLETGDLGMEDFYFSGLRNCLVFSETIDLPSLHRII